jgi:hypothetical protein
MNSRRRIAIPQGQRTTPTMARNGEITAEIYGWRNGHFALQKMLSTLTSP